MSNDLTYERFAEMIGSSVSLELEKHGTITLEVIEAEEAPGPRPDNAFSVLFKGPPDRLLAQATYPMDLGPLGSHPLFLVPVMEQSDGYVYEAMFTRLVD